MKIHHWISIRSFHTVLHEDPHLNLCLIIYTVLHEDPPWFSIWSFILCYMKIHTESLSDHLYCVTWRSTMILYLTIHTVLHEEPPWLSIRSFILCYMKIHHDSLADPFIQCYMKIQPWFSIWPFILCYMKIHPDSLSDHLYCVTWRSTLILYLIIYTVLHEDPHLNLYLITYTVLHEEPPWFSIWSFILCHMKIHHWIFI